MYAIGHVTYVQFFREISFPDGVEHFLRHFTVKPAYAVHFLTGIAGENAHGEMFFFISRMFTAHINKFIPTDLQFLRIFVHVFFEQIFAEAVVACRYRSVDSI
ncbi:hypothetical protein SDC9_211413 [bioreactor metagenome]|uniref:Uncharacterized protein n=1 Tax=bioreactor metagenome TaxID=1076179 RepID=A0A645JIZ1_9ZZZZ